MTVLPEDRMTAPDTIKHLQNLIQTNSRISEPDDEILIIFEKIQKWKDSLGDTEEMEDKVNKALKPKRKLKIHNVKTLLEKMNELKGPIGLTDDEITIIIFTTIDHDYFTNLIIMQGEFLKWFNLDFSDL